MKLTVAERLILLGLLPKEGNFTMIKLVRELRENLSFTEKEHKALEFNNTDGNITWKETVQPKDIQIGEVLTIEIKGILKKMDEEKKLTEQVLTLYEKFMEV